MPLLTARLLTDTIVLAPIDWASLIPAVPIPQRQSYIWDVEQIKYKTDAQTLTDGGHRHRTTWLQSMTLSRALLPTRISPPLSPRLGSLRVSFRPTKYLKRNTACHTTVATFLRHPPADDSICFLMSAARHRFMVDRLPFFVPMHPLGLQRQQQHQHQPRAVSGNWLRPVLPPPSA